jgi:hypothetical protein
MAEQPYRKAVAAAAKSSSMPKGNVTKAAQKNVKSAAKSSALPKDVGSTAKARKNVAAAAKAPKPDLKGYITPGGAKPAAKAKAKSGSKAKAKGKTSEFGKAFAANRKAGAKEFEFKGKKYNTKQKGE